jgi:hypothetical protein
MRLRLAIVCLLALNACAQAPVLKLAEGVKASATVSLPAEARKARALLLHLDGIQPEKGGRFLARVYVDFAAAGADTPADHPGHLGRITLLASSKAAPRNVILPVPEALSNTLRGRASAVVTLVPERGGAAATIARIRFAPAR